MPERSPELRARPAGEVTPPPKRWFAAAYEPDPAVVARGRLEMGMGVGLLMAGSVAVAGAAVSASAPVAGCASIVVWQGLVSAGLLAGSRLARVVTMFSGVMSALSAVGFVGALLRHGDLARLPVGGLVIGAGVLLVAIGSSLTTLAPAARAWHDLRGATLGKTRKARSLTEWRRGSQ